MVFTHQRFNQVISQFFKGFKPTVTDSIRENWPLVYSQKGNQDCRYGGYLNKSHSRGYEELLG